MTDIAIALFAEAAARQGLPTQLEDPSAADRVARLILSQEED